MDESGYTQAAEQRDQERDGVNRPEHWGLLVRVKYLPNSSWDCSSASNTQTSVTP